MNTIWTLDGGLCGRAWSGFDAVLPIKVNLTQERRRIVNGGDRTFQRRSQGALIDAIKMGLTEKDSDFNGARFTGDTVIRATRYWYRSDDALRSRKIIHEWPLTQFPSLANLVDEDTMSWDMEEV